MKTFLIVMLTLYSISNFAQNDNQNNPLTISGYIESYYAYDLSNPDDHNRPGFVYSYNRHNEINLNLGFVKAAYATDNVRANLALMTGTYANANLAAEPGVLKNIYEANAGVKISKSKNLWVDAGIFASHIGFESAVGKDCWNVTRSLLADNSPYYESGVKISYTSDNEKWFISGLILNGWQRIQRVNANHTPALGHQLTYKPNSMVTLNSSSFVGSDTPDSTRQMRYFHNFYGQFQIHETFGMILGFDFGAQQKAKDSNDYNSWYSPVLIVRYSPTDRINLAARVEYYHDANGVIIATNTANGFQTFGYSLNLDYKISDNIVWRIEGRSLESKDTIFVLNDKPSTSNYCVITSLAISI
ncbi:MAG: porin [Saprospiraceae bacterium]|nr:porin [Saprospiraceae bacterium]